jgi:TRAP-type C4-dicarboxylate transport system permease small subunit
VSDVFGIAYFILAAAFGVAMAVIGFRVVHNAIQARTHSDLLSNSAGVVGGFLVFAGGWLILLPYLLIRCTWRFARRGRPQVVNS